MKKPSRKTVVKKLDKVCSDIVRAIGHCMVCGRKDTLQTHHVIGRRNMQVRFFFNNLVCLCALHHRLGIQSAHQDPVWFMEWYKKFLGQVEFDRLRQTANGNRKLDTYELEELYQRYDEIREVKCSQ